MFCSVRFLFQPCVYYKHKILKMMHCEILSEKEFSVNFIQIFSLLV